MLASLRELTAPEKTPLFPFVDGLRAWSILWIISLHTVWVFGYFLDRQSYLIFSARAELTPFFQGHLGVDAFFVISGFLIGYYLFTEYRQYQTVNFRQFYLRRALRLLPAYFAAMLLVAFLYPHNLHTIWANVIYINNFLPLERQFMPWTWSLAIEEQFYTLFPAFVLFLGKSKRALHVLLWLFLLSFVIRFTLSFYFRFQLPMPTHEVVNKSLMYHYFDVIYDKSHARYGGLLVGVIVAYLLVFTDTVKKLNQSHGLRRFLWVASLLILASYIFVPSAHVTATVTETAVVVALIRNVFSMAIGYLILYSLCETGKSWLVRLLSSRIWYPVAQLSYSAYLLHLMVIMLFAQYLYPSMNRDLPSLLGLMLLMMVSTLLASAMIYLWIEKPILELRNHRFPRS